MLQRGRKSAATLTAIAAHMRTITRLAPPDDLTPSEWKVWTDTVNSKPPEWFGPEHETMLRAYVESVSMMRELRRTLKTVRVKDIDMFRHVNSQLQAETKLVLTLATKMRLTQQSQYDEKTAKTNSKSARQSKPWEEPAKRSA